MRGGELGVVFGKLAPPPPTAQLRSRGHSLEIAIVCPCFKKLIDPSLMVLSFLNLSSVELIGLENYRLIRLSQRPLQLVLYFVNIINLD